MDPRLARSLDELFAAERLSRRRFLGRAGGTGLALSTLPALLAACGGDEDGDRGRVTPTPTAVSHPKTQIGDWTFANRPLYVDKQVIADFDERFGGKCDYVEEIKGNFEFFDKVRKQLRAGQPIGRDMVVLTDFLASRWVRLGYCEPLDKKNIPNASNLIGGLKTINYDPRREFTLPWQSGAVGLGYNPKKTGREIRSIGDLFDPEFKGRVTMLSEAYDSASTVLLGDGDDPSQATVDQLLARSRRSARPTATGSSGASRTTTTRTTSPRATPGSRWPTPVISSRCRRTTRSCASPTPRRARSVRRDPGQGQAVPVLSPADEQTMQRAMAKVTGG